MLTSTTKVACSPVLSWHCPLAVRAAYAAALALAFPATIPAYDLRFDYTSFGSGFTQAHFDVLNYASINGNYKMTSTDNHRPEMVAHNNALAEFYNNFNADYNHPTTERRTPAEEAAFINTYTLNNSTNNGPRPEWLILNEISSSQWQLNPGAPGLSEHRTWVIDTVTLLNDVYGYKVITYSPYETVGTGNALSWQALAAKSYIAIESYQSGTEVWNGGSSYASRLAWAQGKYQSSKDTYLAAGVPASRLFVSEHFANTDVTFINSSGQVETVSWGRAGLASAADWDTVLQIRQDAIRNVGFDGFLAYNFSGNGMNVSVDEQLQHEYYYRTKLTLATEKPQWLSDSAIVVSGTTIPLSWSQQLNWKGNVPNTVGAEVNFWRTLTANRTITLDGTKTSGKITFDSPFSYTIGPGTGGSLVLSNSSGPATLASNQGSHMIAVPVQLTAGLSATINTGTTTISGNVTGSGPLTKSGAGTLVLSGAANSYSGDTVVQAGTLRIDSANLSNVADVYLSTGAALLLNYTGGPDIIDSLFINGISQAVGTWGSPTSGAMFTSPLFSGSGKLQVTTYVIPPIVGDYNIDGKVDAADYTVWRNQVGQSSIANRDPNNTGPIGPADFISWRAQFGKTAASGAGQTFGSTTAVPEPSAWGMFVMAFAGVSLGFGTRPQQRI